MTTFTNPENKTPTVQAQVIAEVIMSSSTGIVTKQIGRTVSSSRTQGTANLTYSPKEVLSESSTTRV